MAEIKDIKLQVKINGIDYKIPKSWEDITVAQYLRLKKFEKYNDITFLAIMLNTTEDIILKSDNTNIDLEIYPHLEWYMRESIVDVIASQELKREIEIEGKKIKIPKDLMLKTFEQKIMMEQTLEKFPDPTDALPEILAIYLFNDFYKDKEFNFDEMIEFKDRYIMELPIVVMYPIGTFFLQKLKESTSRKILIWLENIPAKKKEQVLKNLKSSNI